MVSPDNNLPVNLCKIHNLIYSFLNTYDYGFTIDKKRY